MNALLTGYWLGIQKKNSYILFQCQGILNYPNLIVVLEDRVLVSICNSAHMNLWNISLHVLHFLMFV